MKIKNENIRDIKKMFNINKTKKIYKTNHLNIEELKKQQNNQNISEDKKLINSFYNDVENCEIGSLIYFLNNKRKYEVYFYLIINNEIISGLMYKELSSLLFAKMYYFYLQKIFLRKKIVKIVKIVNLKEKRKRKDQNVTRI